MAVGDMWHATAGNGGAASIRPASGTEVMLTAFDVAFSNKVIVKMLIKDAIQAIIHIVI